MRLRNRHRLEGLISQLPRARVACHRKRLGPPSRIVRQDGRVWRVWDDPLYSVFVSRLTVDFLAVDEAAAEQAAEAYLWDIGLTDHLLTRQETKHWQSVGAQAAEPHVIEYIRHTPEKLREFVLGYCDNRICCDFDVSEDDLATVFMPLVFGGLRPAKDSPAAEALAALPDPGPKPEPEPEPGPPPPPVYPPEPESPQLHSYDPEVEQRLLESSPDQAMQSTDDLLTDNPAAVQAYRTNVDEANWLLHEKYREALRLWLQAKDQVNAEYRAARAKYRVAHKAWSVRAKNHEAAVRAWEREGAIAEAVRFGFHETLHRNLGIVYEFYSEAGPRSVNGYPVFFSCRLMHREDWDKVKPVIEAELERRAALEI